MYLEDVDVSASIEREQARKFNRSTQCVSSLFLHCLEKVKTDGIKKVVVSLYRTGVFVPSFENNGEVCFVSHSFDFEHYWKVEEIGKKTVILDIIKRSLLDVAERLDWSQQPFEEAYNCVLEKNIENTQFWRNPKLNSARTAKAAVLYSYNTEQIDVYAVLFDDSGNELQRKVLVRLTPHDTFLYEALGTFEWASSETVRLTSRSGDQIWEVNFP